MLVRWPPPSQPWPYTGFHSQVSLRSDTNMWLRQGRHRSIFATLVSGGIAVETADACRCDTLRDSDAPYAETPADACVMYHSYVEAIPRSSGIRAHHPKAWMRETSSNLRGVPSGREGSKTIRPV
jgi:hypothetical protein